MSNAERRVERVLFNWLGKEPFFADLAMRLPVVLTDQVPLAATDAVRLYLNPAAVTKWTDRELEAVLFHEVAHVACLHFSRRKGRELQLWNAVCDMKINDFLQEYGAKLPEGCLYAPPGMEAHTEEWLYDFFLASGQAPQLAEAQIDLDAPAAFKDEAGGPETAEARAEELASEWRDAVQAAAERAIKAGRGTQALQRFVNTRPVRHDWPSIMKMFAQELVHEDYSWQHPNRRYLPWAFVPSLRNYGMGALLCAVDTSGSIGDVELAKFGGCIQGILDTCYPKKVLVAFCDDAVHNKVEFCPGDKVSLEMAKGSGGTDFRPAFELLKEEPDVVGMVYLTDLEGSFPQRPPHVPVLWLATTSHRVPFGTVVRIPN